MLLEREAIGAVLEVIAREEDYRFYREDHRALFKVLVDLYDQNEPVDLRVILEALRQRGELETVGGGNYLAELVESVPSAANAEHYARIVREKSLLRELIRCTRQIMQDAYDPQEDVQQLLDKAEQEFFRVTEQRIRSQPEHIQALLADAFRQIEAQDGHLVTGLSTGFLELDDLTTGLQGGEMVVVAGRPSMGKTALGLNMAEQIAVKESKPVAFFSMEMSRQQVAQRILCSRAGIDSRKLRRGMLAEPEIAHLGIVCGDLQSAPLFVDDTPSMTVLELRAKARRLALRQRIAAVFVDYLQLMYVPGAESRQQEIAEISRGLKALARDLRVPVVAMAQLNRSPEGRRDHRPIMSDLRESGAIEQDADVVLLLHRDSYYDKNSNPGVADVIIAKQRNGPTGEVKLHFDERFARFGPLAVVPEPDYAAVDEAVSDTPF
jgi:replicative DNA helicase